MVHGPEAAVGAGALYPLPGREPWVIEGRQAVETGGTTGLHYGVVHEVSVGKEPLVMKPDGTKEVYIFQYLSDAARSGQNGGDIEEAAGVAAKIRDLI
jgi:hypothetical protein